MLNPQVVEQLLFEALPKRGNKFYNFEVFTHTIVGSNDLSAYYRRMAETSA